MAWYEDQELVEVVTVFCSGPKYVSQLDGVPAGKRNDDRSPELGIFLHVSEPVSADGLASAGEVGEVQ